MNMFNPQGGSEKQLQLVEYEPVAAPLSQPGWLMVIVEIRVSS